MASPARRPRPGSAKPKRESAGNTGLGGGLADSILKRQSEKRAAGRTAWVKVSDDEEEPTIVRAWDVTPPTMDSDGNPTGGMFRIGYIHQVEFEIDVGIATSVASARRSRSGATAGAWIRTRKAIPAPVARTNWTGA